MEKYVSGIRPSGKLHLGNYLGVIKAWKSLHDSGKNCTFFVANMHGQYGEDDIAKTLIALQRCGLNSRSLRLQSQDKAGILNLYHELSFHANTSRLKNMTQYKEKGGTLALFAYPVLMAADILYHEATHVPIGEDQKQHLELVKELARKTGRNEPAAFLRLVCRRVMDLKDPTKKMSKSNPNPDGVIYLCDSSDDIAKKIRGAVSSRDGVANLQDIIIGLGGEFQYTGENEKLKNYLTELLINELRG